MMSITGDFSMAAVLLALAVISAKRSSDLFPRSIGRRSAQPLDTPQALDHAEVTCGMRQLARDGGTKRDRDAVAVDHRATHVLIPDDRQRLIDGPEHGVAVGEQ